MEVSAAVATGSAGREVDPDGAHLQALRRGLSRRCGTPHPVFFAKSVELHENKRVEFSETAKKRKGVHKSSQEYEKKGNRR